jgi:hypothetical protein
MTRFSASRRERGAAALGTAISLAALLALVLAPIHVPAGRTATLVALALIGALAVANVVVVARYNSQGAISDRLLLDATGVIAIVALWLAGPAVAVLASATPDLVTRWRGPNRLRSLSRLANFASFAAATLAAEGTLAVLGYTPPAMAVTGGSIGALVIAGAVWFLVNYVVARGLVAILAEGRPLLATVARELLPALPSVAAMIATATATAAVTEWLGPFGLIGLVAAVLAPQLTVAVVEYISPAAGGLAIDAGRVRYAAALCTELQLTRRQRRVVRAAARGEPGVRRLSTSLGDIWYAVGAARFYERERFDGKGDFRLSGVMIPIESRVLAVADAWARLTAKGTLAMSQAAAVAALERHQPRFDPQVVAAARSLVGGADAAEQAGRRMPPPTALSRRFVALVTIR